MIRKVLLIVTASLLTISCGEPKIENNKYLGKFPGMYSALNRQLNADRRAMYAQIRSITRNTDTTSMKDPYKSLEKIRKREIEIMKVRDKYASLERTRRMNTADLASLEISAIRGRTIPFMLEYSDHSIRITGVEIEDADTENGTLYLNLRGLGRNVSGTGTDHKVHFVALAPDIEHYLYKGVIDVPLTGRPEITDEDSGTAATYPFSVKFGLPCASVDFVMFSGIIFTDEATFQRLR